MAGLVPAIHVFLLVNASKQDVDARDKRGHDDDHHGCVVPSGMMVPR